MSASSPALSLIVATHSRPFPLGRLLRSCHAQTLPTDQFEIIVVDDGSEPPVHLLDAAATLIRLEGVERCLARNAGAQAATAPLLVFVDDDMELPPDFLASHLEAHKRWPGCLVIGQCDLAAAWKDTPYGRWRATIDSNDWPAIAGPGDTANFCTASNMSVQRQQFFDLGGFDPHLISSEDQDLGRRLLLLGGQVAFCPEAHSTHHDAANTIQKYCRHMEEGNAWQVAFAQKYPDAQSGQKRAAVNGPLRWGAEPPSRLALKVAKSLAHGPLILGALFALAGILEKRRPTPRLLEPLYRLLLGIHLQAGWRAGLRRFTSPPS